MTSMYKLARAARRDLEEISDYLGSEAGLEKALKVLSAIMETIVTLSRYPNAGVAAQQLGTRVRKFPAGKYMIYYRPYRSGRIEVLHVFHGARDQRRAWRGGNTPKTYGKTAE